jgi:hypothetical protein
MSEEDSKTAHPCPYKGIDIKFIDKHKKLVNDFMESYAGEYLSMIRPDNDKKVTIDTQGKDQLMYIFNKLLIIASNMKGNVPEEFNDIGPWIEKSLSSSTSDYNIYMFLKGVTENIKYTLLGDDIEEKTLIAISKFVKDEDLMQHIVEMFLMFIKKFSESLSNLNWETTKKTNSKLVNALLRNMNNNNTNPEIFKEIYVFTEYRKKN